MKISTQTRYALRFLIELALNESPTSNITTLAAAEAQGISEKYLESIASKLKKAGFIYSSKGVRGGYRLAMPLSEISVGRVMRVMENEFFKLHCVDKPEDCCKNYGACVLSDYWIELEDLLSVSLDSMTLEKIKGKIHEQAACAECQGADQ